MLKSRPFPETRPSLLGSLGGPDQPESAWREFFGCYAPSVFRVARQRGLGTDDADDIVQQVMIVVSAHIGDFRYDRDRGRFRDWVRAVTTNKIRDLRRRQQSAQSVVRIERFEVDQLEGSDGTALWEQEWQVQDMLHCLKRVGREIAPNRLEAFKLYTLKGVSAEETAHRLGMSRAHVYVTRTQVIKRLRELMDELDEGTA